MTACEVCMGASTIKPLAKSFLYGEIFECFDCGAIYRPNEDGLIRLT